MKYPLTKKGILLCYSMLSVTLLLVAATFLFLCWSSTTEQTLRSVKQLVNLNGPWKFITGDSIQYVRAVYNDSRWENKDLTAPVGVFDDDVGL